MKRYKYIEWFDAGEMHEHSKEWFSELSFVKDEQQFLSNLIVSFAIKPLDKKGFEHIDDFKKAINTNQHQLNSLYKQLRKHINQLEIMMDGVNQLEMEQAYRKTHKKLNMKVDQYLLDYRGIKDKGFAVLTSILKKGKTKKMLGNPQYKLRVSEN